MKAGCLFVVGKCIFAKKKSSVYRAVFQRAGNRTELELIHERKNTEQALPTPISSRAGTLPYREWNTVDSRYLEVEGTL